MAARALPRAEMPLTPDLLHMGRYEQVTDYLPMPRLGIPWESDAKHKQIKRNKWNTCTSAFIRCSRGGARITHNGTVCYPIINNVNS